MARSMDAASWWTPPCKASPKAISKRGMGCLSRIFQRMPRLVAKLFAVPAMQSYNYRVMLDRDARIAPRYPRACG